VFSTQISSSLARERVLDVSEGIRNAKRGRVRRADVSADDTADVTIRVAQASDSRALRDLAQLDSHDALEGYVLVAEVAGELRAALAVSDGASVADPFHPTQAIVSLLALRARQLRSGQAQPSRGAARRSLVAVPNR